MSGDGKGGAGVLFVCLGNICRSPAAEGVFAALAERAGLGGRVRTDSAGTGSWHAGERADARMREHAKRRGFELPSRARQITQKDFDDFDFIVTMDESVHRDVTAMARDDAQRSRVSRMTDHLTTLSSPDVPDPYYKGPEGFELVLDLVEDASKGLLDKVRGKLA